MVETAGTAEPTQQPADAQQEPEQQPDADAKEPLQEREQQQERAPETVEQLRSWWEFAAVAQFMHLFCDGFGMDDFDTEHLEACLLGGPPTAWLPDLQVQMLRFAANDPSVEPSTWLRRFDAEFRKRLDMDKDGDDEDSDEVDRGSCSHAAALFTYVDGLQYASLPLRTKVLVLHHLCEWQLERPEEFKPTMSPKEDEAVNWRIEPVGFDAEGNTYFLFDDNRLYLEREQKRAPSRRGKKRRRPSKPHKKAPADDEESFGDATPSSNWVLVCRTASDWHALAKRFEGSDHPDEQAFYQYLIEDAVPSVSKEFKALEEKKRLEEALMNRKRSSRLQMRQVIKMEEEERLKKEADEQRRQRKSQEASSMSSLDAARQLAAETAEAANAAMAEAGKAMTAAEKREQEARRREAEKIAQEAARKAREEERERRREERELRIAKNREAMLIKRGRHPLMADADTSSRGISPSQPSSSSPCTDPVDGHQVKSEHVPIHPANIVPDDVHAMKVDQAEQPERNPESALASDIPDSSSTAAMPITAATTVEALPPESAPVQDEEESWLFNCRCGLKGQNIDDGTPIVACEDCNVWQHIGCIPRRSSKLPSAMATEINIDEWQAKVFVCANCTRKRRKRAADQTASTPATPVKKPKTDRSKSATAPKTVTSKTATKAAPAAPGLPTSKASADGHSQSVPHKLQTSTLASGQSSAQSSPCRSPLAAKSRSGNPRQSRPSRPPLSAGPAGMSETQIEVDAAVALTTHSNEQQQQQTMPPMGGMLTGLDAIVAALQSEAETAFASSASSTQLSTHRHSSLHETGAPLDGLHPSPSKAPKASIAAIPRTAPVSHPRPEPFQQHSNLALSISPPSTTGYSAVAAVTNSPTKSYADPSLLAAIFAAAPTLPAAPAAPQHSLVSAASPSLRAAAGDASE